MHDKVEIRGGTHLSLVASKGVDGKKAGSFSGLSDKVLDGQEKVHGGQTRTKALTQDAWPRAFRSVLIKHRLNVLTLRIQKVT